jgi:hypothetical protein
MFCGGSCARAGEASIEKATVKIKIAAIAAVIVLFDKFMVFDRIIWVYLSLFMFYFGEATL